MSNERHETVADNVSVKHQFREVAKMIPHIAWAQMPCKKGGEK